MSTTSDVELKPSNKGKGKGKAKLSAAAIEAAEEEASLRAKEARRLRTKAALFLEMAETMEGGSRSAR